MTWPIHREIYGSGKPLVLLHGWAMHTGVWREFAQTLGQMHQVICLDLPGHGHSQAMAPFQLQTVVDALLEAIPAKQFSLLGWSLGATLALDMAARYPQRVEKLLLLAGNPRFVADGAWPGMPAATLDAFSALLAADVAQTLARFLALQVNGLAHGKPLLQQLKTALQQTSPPTSDILLAGLNMLKCCDLRQSLIKVAQPVAVILGERDQLVPVAVATHLAQIKPNAELHVLENAGHAPFLSHAEELAQILDRFVS